MKKVLLVLLVAIAFSSGAYAQRRTVAFLGVGVATNFRSAEEGKTGPALTVGFRNYNRDALISVGVGAEAFGDYIPSKTKSVFGAYAIPEVGLGIGPGFFKVYPHTGIMIGYDSSITHDDSEKTGGFGWGGKDGIAFEFGRHVTLDFSAYVPRYRFREALYAFNFIWRF